MRSFIAINFNDTVRSRLLGMCDDLRSHSKRGRFSLPENLHLTLVFIGECDAPQVNAVKAMMDGISFRPFEVTIDRIGRFRRDGGDIWWAGVRDSAHLSDIYNNITKKLTAAGFDPDTRKFSPHITLGREVVTDNVPRNIEPFGETVNKIELMSSERIGGKLTYAPIHKKEASV